VPSRRIPKYFYKGVRVESAERQGAADGWDQPALTWSDPRLAAFLQVNFDVLYDWNVQTGTIYFSEQLDLLLGYPLGQFPRTFHGWLEHLHPEDRADASEQLWEAVRDDRVFQGEYRMRRVDGDYIWITDQAIVLTDEQGRPTDVVGAMKDVTQAREARRAQREAEELRRVLFRISSPTWHVDAGGRYLDADGSALVFFERTREEMLAGSVEEDFPAEVANLLQADRLGPERSAQVEVDCLVNDTTKTLVLTAIPCYFGDERTYFLLGTDITAQKTLQRELARSERALLRQATILDERNAALRVLLAQREEDRRELEDRIVHNVEHLIEPSIERLSKTMRHRPERLEIEALHQNLREIVGPFAKRLLGSGDGRAPLTRREFEVADMVRLGKTTAEIAAALHISQSAVSFHRANIRTKLGLPKGGPQLATHLAALARE
jgi:PAS domain-containing protein/DNA-binding CsgD family transcriptional regulator